MSYLKHSLAVCQNKCVNIFEIIREIICFLVAASFPTIRRGWGAAAKASPALVRDTLYCSSAGDGVSISPGVQVSNEMDVRTP